MESYPTIPIASYDSNASDLHCEIALAPQTGPAHPKKRKVCRSHHQARGHQQKGHRKAELLDGQERNQGIDESNRAENGKNIAPTVRPLWHVIHIHLYSLPEDSIFTQERRPS